jgi:hypothetical protein
MAKEPADDAGTIQTMLDRLKNWRLPRALDIKKKVDQGGTLDGNDIQFLKTVFEDAGKAQSIAARHSELKTLVAKLTSLYAEITQKALENEQKSGGRK